VKTAGENSGVEMDTCVKTFTTTPKSTTEPRQRGQGVKLSTAKKKCRICKETYTAWNSLQKVCSPKCAIVHTNNEKLRARKKDIRQRKQALKTKSDWLKECQTVFNAYIRERDKDNVCISCQKSEQELKINNPIAMVCGHYLSVASHPELRYSTFNANLQCTRCNGGAGKYGQFNSKAKTVTQDYRENLIKKIGLENVEWLEGPHQAQHWTIEDIKEIKQWYKDQLKYLKG